MVAELKKEILDLLDKDIEFRYAIAGYLGLSEIIKGQEKIWENLNKIWENLNRLWENQNKLLENQNKLWEEVKALREDQKKLWENQNKLLENQNKLWEEVKALREGQDKLLENQNKLWEEVRALREGENKLWENVNKLWEEVRNLRAEVRNLRRDQRRLWIYMKRGFRDLRRALGASFEDYAASFIEMLLDEMGYTRAMVERKVFVHEGKPLEINIFCEKPLVIGEVTTMIENEEQAKEEIEKLLERIRFVEANFRKKPFLAILAVSRATKEAAEVLEDLAKQHNIKIVLGKEIMKVF